MRVRIWPVLLASGLGLVLLLSLGVWQVQRLAWKNAIIAQVDSRNDHGPCKFGATPR